MRFVWSTRQSLKIGPQGREGTLEGVGLRVPWLPAALPTSQSTGYQPLAGHTAVPDCRDPTSAVRLAVRSSLPSGREGRRSVEPLECVLGERSWPWLLLPRPCPWQHELRGWLSSCPRVDAALLRDDGASGRGVSGTSPGLSASRPSGKGGNFHLPLSCGALLHSLSLTLAQTAVLRGLIPLGPAALRTLALLTFPALTPVGDSQAQL